MISNWFTQTFNVKYPIILAPMFLVSNEEMIIAAAEAGIAGCIPALNYRTPDEFEAGMKRLKEKCSGAFGINLIVNKSNVYLDKQIKICATYKPDFIITSLGSPEAVIKQCSPQGVKIICDVVDLKYAQKVESLGADAIIAVNSGAGGHAGPIAASILIPSLMAHCKIPVISAGGVGTGAGLLSTLALGAAGVSIGSIFISAKESKVSNDYKDAIVKYGSEDIVMTTKISGTPCSVINTPYVQKIGTKQNMLEQILSKNKKIKKYAKMLTYYKGTKLLEKAAFAASYKSVWCAGPSIEFVSKEETIKETVDRIMNEYNQSFKKLQALVDKNA